jgi:hypothetical protein
MVESLADFVELFVLLSVLINLFLLGEATFSEFANLHLVVASIEELSFVLFDTHPKHFNLLRQSLYLDGLEHHNELYVLS